MNYLPKCAVPLILSLVLACCGTGQFSHVDVNEPPISPANEALLLDLFDSLYHPENTEFHLVIFSDDDEFLSEDVFSIEQQIATSEAGLKRLREFRGPIRFKMEIFDEDSRIPKSDLRTQRSVEGMYLNGDIAWERPGIDANDPGVWKIRLNMRNGTTYGIALSSIPVRDYFRVDRVEKLFVYQNPLFGYVN